MGTSTLRQAEVPGKIAQAQISNSESWGILENTSSNRKMGAAEPMENWRALPAAFDPNHRLGCMGR